jgi:hypothetical protein
MLPELRDATPDRIRSNYQAGGRRRIVDPKPFERLVVPRALSRADLPADLAKFYAENEGVGLESSPDRIVRLCRVDEVVRVAWRDLHVLGQDEGPGWESFAAFRIGLSSFFDEIVYVLDSPCCSRGAVLALGTDISGPAGEGPCLLEPSLLLAASFQEWIQHMEQTDWMEYGFVPGGIDDLAAHEQEGLRRYYQRLNPGISWGAT